MVSNGDTLSAVESQQSCNEDCEPDSKRNRADAVKSSAGGVRKRICCEHGHKNLKSIRTNVACQTEDLESGWLVPSQSILADKAGMGAFRVSAPQASPKKDNNADEAQRSEGTLRLMIHNFRNMNDTVRGPPKVVSGVPWKIMVMPRQHVVAKKGTQKCLGFFLQCCPESYSDSWSCQASAELRLVSQKPSVSNFVRKTSHVYTAKENDWGYSCFMTWMDILDENQGYMKDESVILEVYVKAESPKGILSHEAFCKKLHDYMKLADLQCSRNLIDKALEVNMSAMKFCKDKDDKMKAELEAQKKRLIDKKVKQSIERIEREGDKKMDSIENNPMFLKQAISGCAGGKTGSNKNAKEKNGSKGSSGCNSAVNKANTGAVAVANTDNRQATDNRENDTAAAKEDDSSPEKPVVNNLIKELVSNVSRKQFDELVQLEEAEPSCSDESEDSDYEDIDEVCDSCLFERLETLSNDTPLDVIETQEISCQTDAGSNIPPPPNAVVPSSKSLTARMPPAGADEASMRLSSPAVPMVKALTPCSKESRLQFSAEIRRHHCQQFHQGEDGKAHLNSIKDTLERLVSLAQGGSEMSNNIQLDLNMLKSKSPVKTDFVEIPASLPTSPLEDQPALGVGKNSEAVSEQLPVPPLVTQPVTGAQAVLPPSFKNGNGKQAAEEEKVACDLNWQKQQQFVQTDLSYTPRTPSPVTEEDCSILKHAKELVENKTEELVSKYSQLIEQSEANRLAETVKKVEKRMKDIERQTMTCRKELADECERHYKEEQKLIKANKQLKMQLEQANERFEKLNAQFKERKGEIKRLEKRLKVECMSSAENLELNNKIESLEKELQNLRTKHAEEKQRWLDENQRCNEAKKSLQQELNFASSEAERMHMQIEEKALQIRKMEKDVKQERGQAQQSLKELTERAKKAEINLLDFRLEIGLKLLQRASDDCLSQVAQLEEIAKRYSRSQPSEDLKSLNAYIQQWVKTKEVIHDIIGNTKNEFGKQVESVRNGMPLSSLPILEVPRPPPPPQMPKCLLPVQPPEQRQPLAPIGVNPASSVKSVPVNTSSSTDNVGAGHVSSKRTFSQPNALQNGPVSNLSYDPKPASGGAAVSSVTFEASQPSSVTVGGGQQGQIHLGPIGGMSRFDSSQRTDFTPWSDPLIGITQTLFGGKNVGGGMFDGFNGGAASAAPMPSYFSQKPPQSNSAAAAATTHVSSAGQWLGWGYQQIATAGGSGGSSSVSGGDALPSGIRPNSRAQGGGSPRQHQGLWNPPSSSVHGSFEMSGNATILPDSYATTADEGCSLCGSPLRSQATYTLNCAHVFHTSCVTQWLTSHRACPVCCAYSLPPEEYPDLA